MKCWLWMVQGRFFSLPFASPVVFWASEMPCEQNSDTVCRRAATAAYFFCIWHIGKCQWFLVSRMLCYFVPRCQIAVEKHRSELKQVSMDQADSGGGLGWGFFCGWVLGFFFFVQKTSLCTRKYFFMYFFIYQKEAKQIASWIPSFHFSLVHIAYQCCRKQDDNISFKDFFFLLRATESLS